MQVFMQTIVAVQVPLLGDAPSHDFQEWKTANLADWDRFTDGSYAVRCGEETQRAHPGDWIYTDHYGNWRVCREHIFRLRFVTPSAAVRDYRRALDLLKTSIPNCEEKHPRRWFSVLDFLLRK